ncbi:MAG: epimerase, partial [Acidobacteriota bacterium]|nr:epimerase [Acidobacteriota bacterium]
KLDGLPVNVGSNEATTIRRVAELVSDALGIRIEPLAQGEFRPGEMRHLISDTTRIREAAGYEPQTDLADGIARYINWIREQMDVRDYFAAAEHLLRAKGIVHRVGS